MPLVFAPRPGDGNWSGGGEVPQFQRCAASTALRRLVLSAAACDGVAAAAASAAEEIALLRADVARATGRDPERSQQSIGGLYAARSASLKDSERRRAAEVEAASMAAKARAEAALQAHRRAQAALRRQASAPNGISHPEPADVSSRREISAALAEAAEARAELATTKLELQAEKEASKKLTEEFVSLGHKLREVQATAARSQDELSALRSSSAAKLNVLEEELREARARGAAEVAAALEAKKAAEDALAAATKNASALETALDLKEKEVGLHSQETLSLKKQLQELADNLEKAQEEVAAHAATQAKLAAVEEELASERARQQEQQLQLQKVEAAEDKLAATERELASERAKKEEQSLLLESLQAQAAKLASVEKELAEERAQHQEKSLRLQSNEATEVKLEAMEKELAEERVQHQEKSLLLQSNEASHLETKLKLTALEEELAAAQVTLAKLGAVEKELAEEKARQAQQLNVQVDQESVNEILARERQSFRVCQELVQRREEVARRAFTTLLAAELEGTVARAFHAWRLQQGQSAQEAAKDRVSMGLRSLVDLLSRRDEANRRVVASLLAERLETFVRGVFLAWRNVTGREQVPKEEGRVFDDKAWHRASEATKNLEEAKQQLSGAAMELEGLKREAREASAREEALEARTRAAEEALRELEEELEMSKSGPVTSEEVDRLRVAQAELQSHLELSKVASASAAAQLEKLQRVAALLSRREATTRNVIASLVAKALEACVLGAFLAWRDVTQKARSEAGSPLASSQSVTSPASSKGSASPSQIQVLQRKLEEEKEKTATAREEERAALAEILALRQQLRDMPSSSKAKDQELAKASKRATELQEELDTLQKAFQQTTWQLQDAESELQKATQRAGAATEVALEATSRIKLSEATTALLTKRELAFRAFVSGLLASHLELLLGGVFSAWRDQVGAVSLVPQEELQKSRLELAAAEKKAKDAEVGQRSVSVELQKVRQELSAAEKKLREAEAAAELLREAQEDLTKSKEAEASAEELQQVRQDLSAAQQKANDAEAALLQLQKFRDELAAADKKTKDAEVELLESASRIKSLDEALKAERQTAASAQACAAFMATRESATRSVLSHLLAAQLELALRGAFVAWRQQVAAPGPAAPPEALTASDAEKDLLKVQLALLTKRETVMRAVISSLLAAQREQLLQGVFLTWLEIARQSKEVAEDDDEDEGDVDIEQLLPPLNAPKVNLVTSSAVAPLSRPQVHTGSLPPPPPPRAVSANMAPSPPASARTGASDGDWRNQWARRASQSDDEPEF